VKIRCSHCFESYDIDEKRLSGFGEAVSLPCPKCKGIIKIHPLSGSDNRVPLPSTREDGEKSPPPKKASEGDALKERILDSLKDLPPMPQVAQKAREVISNPNSSFSELAKVIEIDQAILTRVLKIANSSYYGLSGKVSTVQHAAVVLGSKALMEILNLACSSEILGGLLRGYDLDAGDLWTHSLAVAAGSQLIARRVNPRLEQDAFTAGVIHDVGKVILDPYILERKEAFRAFVADGKDSFLNAENHILGFDHATLAMEACRKWKIPDPITKAIQYHHDPTPSQNDLLCYIVHTADAIAIMSGIGVGIDGMLYTLHPEATTLLKISPEDLGTLMGQMAEFVEKTAQ
jgi:putative nucleotidyltransferase with HDIG domain